MKVTDAEYSSLTCIMIIMNLCSLVFRHKISFPRFTSLNFINSCFHLTALSWCTEHVSVSVSGSVGLICFLFVFLSPTHMLLKSSRYVSSPLPSDIRLSSLSISLASTCEEKQVNLKEAASSNSIKAENRAACDDKSRS